MLSIKIYKYLLGQRLYLFVFNVLKNNKNYYVETTKRHFFDNVMYAMGNISTMLPFLLQFLKKINHNHGSTRRQIICSKLVQTQGEQAGAKGCYNVCDSLLLRCRLPQ